MSYGDTVSRSVFCVCCMSYGDNVSRSVFCVCCMSYGDNVSRSVFSVCCMSYGDNVSRSVFSVCCMSYADNVSRSVFCVCCMSYADNDFHTRISTAISMCCSSFLYLFVFVNASFFLPSFFHSIFPSLSCRCSSSERPQTFWGDADYSVWGLLPAAPCGSREELPVLL